MGAVEEEDTVSPDPLQVCCPLGLSRAWFAARMNCSATSLLAVGCLLRRRMSSGIGFLKHGHDEVQGGPYEFQPSQSPSGNGRA